MIELALKISENGKLLVCRDEFLSRPNLVCPTDIEGEKRLEGICFKKEFRLVDIGKKLLPNVEAVYGKPIVPKLVIGESIHQLHGCIQFFGDRAETYVIKRNLCWIRFAQVKELMHAYLGVVEEEWNVNRNFENAAKVRSIQEVDENTLLTDEQAAYFLALEVLFPFGLRKKQFDRLVDSGANTYQIAKAYLVPETAVKLFFDHEYSNYAGISYRINLEKGGKAFDL
ncbi:MAG: hypothetical protein RR133_02155 [Kiritimatiellia bacterium]